MSEPGPRVAHWFDIVTDLLRQPLTTLPRRYLMARLVESFDATAVSWNWRDADGAFGLRVEPGDALDPVVDLYGLWRSGELQDDNPLLTWYAATADPRPWTIERVPTRMVPRRDRGLHDITFRPIGLHQQLSISYRLDGPVHRAFVVGRGGRDFSDEDLVVARYVQRGLTALDTQTQLIARLSGSSTLPAGTGDAELTGRELLALTLLAAGCSTRLIGQRMGCSPRTVEKHLERVYRKLGVRDRLNAVRVAAEAGIIRGTAVPRS